MASGQQLAEENVHRFETWVASKTDDDLRSMCVRGVLSRSDIAAECGFSKSALSQNPRIKERLRALEQTLRERGVLPSLAPVTEGDGAQVPLRQPGGQAGARDAERLKRLEQENASLRAELAEVKRALSRFAVLQEILSETGRLPR